MGGRRNVSHENLNKNQYEKKDLTKNSQFDPPSKFNDIRKCSAFK